MPDDEIKDPPEEEELDEEVERKAYPLAEGSEPVEIEGRMLSKLILYPQGAKVPENNNELAKLLTKKEKELEKTKKDLEKSKESSEKLEKDLKEANEKLSKIEDDEKTELSKGLNELREKVGLEKIEDEKMKELSLEVVKAKFEDAKALSEKVEDTPGEPKPKTKKELNEEKTKEEQKRALRKKVFGHEFPIGDKRNNEEGGD